jgi:hypothetical protein
MKYSADLLAELPVKFLLSAAESQQAQFEGMFPSLLRNIQFPKHKLSLNLKSFWINPGV